MKRIVVITLCIFLLLGAVVNVAVAWAIAIGGNYQFDPELFYSPNEKPRWMCSVSFGSGMTRTSFVPDNGHWGGDASPADDFTIPYWSRARISPSVETINDDTMPWYIEHAYGWPMRSGISELRRSMPTNAWSVIDGIEVLRRNDGSPIPFRDIPIRSLWPGFAINTLFYATILWLLFAFPFRLRRWRRIRRGQCAKCAYDLRGHGKSPHPISGGPLPEGEGVCCPECGAVVTPSRDLTHHPSG